MYVITYVCVCICIYTFIYIYMYHVFGEWALALEFGVKGSGLEKGFPVRECIRQFRMVAG